jgi:hypothetical protein
MFVDIGHLYVNTEVGPRVLSHLIEHMVSQPGCISA